MSLVAWDIKKACFNTPYQDVTELNLSHMGLTDLGSLGAPPLPSLRNLSLSFNRLTSVQSLSSLSQLQSLNISYCQISSLRSITSLTDLTSLNFSHNRISSLDPISSFTKLRQLWTHCNRIHSSAEAVSKILSPLTSLSCLSLQMGNEIQLSFEPPSSYDWLDPDFESDLSSTATDTATREAEQELRRIRDESDNNNNEVFFKESLVDGILLKACPELRAIDSRRYDSSAMRSSAMSATESMRIVAVARGWDLPEAGVLDPSKSVGGGFGGERNGRGSCDGSNANSGTFQTGDLYGDRGGEGGVAMGEGEGEGEEGSIAHQALAQLPDLTNLFGKGSRLSNATNITPSTSVKSALKNSSSTPDIRRKGSSGGGGGGLGSRLGASPSHARARGGIDNDGPNDKNLESKRSKNSDSNTATASAPTGPSTASDFSKRIMDLVRNGPGGSGSGSNDASLPSVSEGGLQSALDLLPKLDPVRGLRGAAASGGKGGTGNSYQIGSRQYSSATVEKQKRVAAAAAAVPIDANVVEFELFYPSRGSSQPLSSAPAFSQKALVIRRNGAATAFWPDGSPAITIDADYSNPIDVSMSDGGEEENESSSTLNNVSSSKITPSFQVCAMYRSGMLAATWHQIQRGTVQYPKGSAALIGSGSGSGTVYHPAALPAVKWNLSGFIADPSSSTSSATKDGATSPATATTVDILLDATIGMRWTPRRGRLTLFFSLYGICHAFECGVNRPPSSTATSASSAARNQAPLPNSSSSLSLSSSSSITPPAIEPSLQYSEVESAPPFFLGPMRFPLDTWSNHESIHSALAPLVPVTSANAPQLPVNAANSTKKSGQGNSSLDNASSSAFGQGISSSATTGGVLKTPKSPSNPKERVGSTPKSGSSIGRKSNNKSGDDNSAANAVHTHSSTRESLAAENLLTQEGEREGEEAKEEGSLINREDRDAMAAARAIVLAAQNTVAGMEGAMAALARLKAL
mmetsp:Transcript_4681/g.8518  ORF Transcript_4681/g.8518 Transcript_4681/m.8518 type:complete len:976 (-) Transcript_4681:103-3030(-)